MTEREDKMSTKIGTLLGFIIIIIILFLARITGIYIHIVLASLCLLILVKHAMKKREHSAQIHKKWKNVNRIVGGLLIAIVISGIAMSIESIYLHALIVHKITSVLFLVFILLHCKQHILYWKMKKE